jgi:hypothetical protein
MYISCSYRSEKINYIIILILYLLSVNQELLLYFWYYFNILKKNYFLILFILTLHILIKKYSFINSIPFIIYNLFLLLYKIIEK